jgi:hypothetical protein
MSGDSRWFRALPWLAVGGLALYQAIDNAVAFDPRPVVPERAFSPFLFRWGVSISGGLAGALLATAGLAALRARDPARDLKALHFINEPSVPGAPVIAAFLLLMAMEGVVLLPRSTGAYGFKPVDTLAVAVLFALGLFGAWGVINGRRLTVVDAESKVLEVSFGKPWVVLKRRSPFRDFEKVVVEVQPMKRGRQFRIVAVGATRQLITVTFTEESANHIAESVRRATGWA